MGVDRICLMRCYPPLQRAARRIGGATFTHFGAMRETDTGRFCCRSRR
jgi:hypothetical protein